MESVISASLIALVIRSRKPFFKNRLSKYLLIVTIIVVVATLILPFTPFGGIFGFSRLPIAFLLLVAIVVLGYIISAEMVKAVFYEKVRF